jgi:hypothetical protein
VKSIVENFNYPHDLYEFYPILSKVLKVVLGIKKKSEPENSFNDKSGDLMFLSLSSFREMKEVIQERALSTET